MQLVRRTACVNGAPSHIDEQECIHCHRVHMPCPSCTAQAGGVTWTLEIDCVLTGLHIATCPTHGRVQHPCPNNPWIPQRASLLDSVEPREVRAGLLGLMLGFLLGFAACFGFLVYTDHFFPKEPIDTTRVE
jgi:hypothetical protein